jgi:hypothetical protein
MPFVVGMFSPLWLSVIATCDYNGVLFSPCYYLLV